MIKLYDYQTHIESELDKHNTENCCVQLATGGGKTFTFAHYLIEQAKKTTTVRFMVLVHREELLQQTIESFRDLGQDPDVVCATGTTLELQPRNYGEVTKEPRFVVAMVETLAARIEKGFTFPGVDTVVIDECHRGEFFKITGGWEYSKKTGQLEYIDGLLQHRRRIGFTATPVFMEKKRAMALYYDKLIAGADIDERINFGSLVQPNTYVAPIDPQSFQNLEAANNAAGFSSPSLNGIFTTPEMIASVFTEYMQHGFGRQTLVFAVSVKHANLLHEHFIKKGINARVYHSKGDNIESRREVVQWFKSNPDAVLINVDVFTTGFDCKTVGCVLLARSTRSLSLFLQIAGRGGRSYSGDDYIKTSWNFVDLGFNIEGVEGVFRGHGTWEKPRAKQWQKEWNNFSLETEAMPTKACPECEHENRITAKSCEKCGTEFPKSVNVPELLARQDSKLYSKTNEDKEIETICRHAIKAMHRRSHKPSRAIYLMIEKLFETTIERHQITPEQWDTNETKLRTRLWQLFEKYYLTMCEIDPETYKPQRITTGFWQKEFAEKTNIFWIERKEQLKLQSISA